MTVFRYSDDLRRSIAELRTERARLTAEADQLTPTATRSLAQVDARASQIIARAAEIDAEITSLTERAVELEALDAARASAPMRAGSSAPDENASANPSLTHWRSRNPWTTGDVSTAAAGSDLIARAATALERTRFGDDGRREHLAAELQRVEEDGSDLRSDLARWTVAASDDDYLRATMKLLADPMTGHIRLTDNERQAMARMDTVTRAMSNTDANGGYLSLPLALDPAIRLSNNGATNPLAALATVRTIAGTDTYRVNYSAGVTASWDGEAAAVSDDAPTLAVSDITAHKWQAFVPFSIEFGDDAEAFAEEMARLLVDGADRLEADALMTGSGTSQPWGIITRLDANTNVEVVVTTDGSFGIVDVFKAHKALPARFRPNSAWLGHIGVIDKIRTDAMALASAESLWNNLGAGQAPELLGHGLYEATGGLVDFTSTTGAANLLMLGDYAEAYTVVRRAGTRIELIPHLFDGTNNRPTGQRGWFAWGRTGGDCVVQVAARLLQNQ